MTEKHQSVQYLFENKETIKKIKGKMPYLFQLAEVESSRAGKIGMEVGSVRERIIIALLISEFGESNVGTDQPITKAETDCCLYGEPISIKTITGNLNGIKLIWTVDRKKAKEFQNSYYPEMSLLLAQIRWNEKGYFFHFSKEVQQEIFKKIGKRKYMKMPKPGTNPRGVELSKEALLRLSGHKDTDRIEINWTRGEIDIDVYDRWLELWNE